MNPTHISSDYSLIRLRVYDVLDLNTHILELPSHDRYLRFGYSASDDNITSYVEKSISAIDNYWWGIYDHDLLIASLHVAVGSDVAEFAFTVHVDYRGQKLGQLLFARGYQLVTEFRIDKIYLACLSQNAGMRAIAKKFGLSVVTYGSDTEATITIQYPVPMSQIEKVKMCIIDKGIINREQI
jgi:RimJ/RimL family protein N-acetyltransferase